jgi:hypothetical protein
MPGMCWLVGELVLVCLCLQLAVVVASVYH